MGPVYRELARYAVMNEDRRVLQANGVYLEQRSGLDEYRLRLINSEAYSDSHRNMTGPVASTVYDALMAFLAKLVMLQNIRSVEGGDSV